MRWVGSSILPHLSPLLTTLHANLSITILPIFIRLLVGSFGDLELEFCAELDRVAFN
jgi:hypothetical protein